MHGLDPVQNGFFDGLERQSSQSSQELCPSDQQLDDRSIHLPFLKKGNQIDASNKKPCLDDNLNRPSSILETQNLMEGPEVIELSAGLSKEKIEVESDLNQSTSILDQIFGSAISMTVGESEVLVELILCLPFQSPSLYTCHVLFLMSSSPISLLCFTTVQCAA